MSYSLRQVIYPALGKEAEARAQLTEWARTLQARGRDLSLTARIFSSEGSALSAVTRADDLAEIERQRQENAADADWQARAARLRTVLRAPVRSELVELIIPQPPASTPPGIIVVARGFPALGQEAPVRAIVEEFVRSGQQAGLRQWATQRIYSSDGSALEVVTAYADLAEVGRVRQERLQISSQAAAAVSELSRAPIEQRLFEVVVPRPIR